MEKQKYGSNERLGYSEENYKNYIKWAWIALLAFSAMYMFTYNGRQNMGPALPYLFSEFGWTKTQAGVLSSLLFWAYAVGQLINGRLGEIVGPKMFAFAGVMLSIGTNILISFQSTFMGIAILWTLNGYFQSMAFAPGLALIAKWWPAKKRGMATGIVVASLTLAQLVTWLSVLGAFYIWPEGGWKAAFRLPVLLTVAFALGFWFLTRPDQKSIGLEPFEEDPAVAAQEQEFKSIVAEKGVLYPYTVIFRHWTFSAWCVLIIFISAGRYALLTWIGTYFYVVFKLNLKHTVLVTVVLPLGMCVGAFLFPYFSDKFWSHNRAIGICFGSLVVSILCIFMPRMETVMGAQVLLFFIGVSTASAALVWAYASDVGTRVFTGTAVGTLDFFAYVGAALQGIVLGGLLDKYDDWLILFYIMAFIYFIMFIVAAIAGWGASTAKRKREAHLGIQR